MAELGTINIEIDLSDLINLGIELMKIDVTQYLIEKLKLAEFNPFPNGSWVFSLEGQLIDFEGSFIASNGEIKGLNIEFYHDFNYQVKDPENGKITHHSTECVFFLKDVENEILNLL